MFSAYPFTSFFSTYNLHWYKKKESLANYFRISTRREHMTPFMVHHQKATFSYSYKLIFFVISTHIHTHTHQHKWKNGKEKGRKTCWIFTVKGKTLFFFARFLCEKMEGKTSSGSKNYVINFLSVQKVKHLKKISEKENKSSEKVRKFMILWL